MTDTVDISKEAVERCIDYIEGRTLDNTNVNLIRALSARIAAMPAREVTPQEAAKVLLAMDLFEQNHITGGLWPDDKAFNALQALSSEQPLIAQETDT